LLIDKGLFISDLKENFIELEKFDIQKSDAPLFVPPYELYNDSISQWCKEVGLTLVSFTPSTRCNADNTIPEMREMYFSSEEIYNNIMTVESKETLNGHILLFHIGSDPRRTDKFYTRLSGLIGELKSKGYEFTDLKKAIQ
jgi:peptidoglycan/xylan/chitin deacetylase (PgdA/CDA1 family)